MHEYSRSEIATEMLTAGKRLVLNQRAEGHIASWKTHLSYNMLS